MATDKHPYKRQISVSLRVMRGNEVQIVVGSPDRKPLYYQEILDAVANALQQSKIDSVKRRVPNWPRPPH